MIIRYKKKFLRSKLLFGVGFTLLGIASILFADNSVFFIYGYISLGLLSLATYLFEKQKQYLKIENGVLTKNSLFPKNIYLSDIIQIKKFAGDLTLITSTKKLTINIELIDEESFIELELLLKTLALKKL